MQLVLSPIYLLGAFTAGSTPQAGALLPFLAVHLGLYGGATAFNSYHDRDTGPIAFVRRPRPVSRGEMRAAIILQVASAAVLAWIRPVAGMLALVMLLMGVAYSHPRTRWKRSTWGSLAAVAIGQGAGGFLLGYLVSGGAAPRAPVLAATGSALAVAGLYPITQVYQVAEDRRRGDMTLPVVIGWRRALVASGVAVCAGSWLLAAALGPRLGTAGVVSLSAAPFALAGLLAAWARRFEAQAAERRHDWAMGIAIAASIFFLAMALLLLPRAARAERAADIGARAGVAGATAAAGASPADVHSIGDLLTVETSLGLPFPPDEVWPVVLDFEHLADFMPNVRSSEVLLRTPWRTTVRQTGSTRFVVRETLHVDLVFHQLNEHEVAFEQLRGDFDDFRGIWSVLPEGAGSRVRYRAWITQSFGVPAFLLRHVIRRDAARMMPAIATEVARRHAEGGR